MRQLRLKIITFTLFALLMATSCEKRFEVEGDFLSPPPTLFCEILGVDKVGFHCNVSLVSLVNSVSPSTSESTFRLRIMENNKTIIDTDIPSGYTFIPFQQFGDAKYQMTLENGALEASSKAPMTLPPSVQIDNSSVDQEFVDSLGFDVASSEIKVSNKSPEKLYFQRSYTLKMPESESTDIELPDTLSSGHERLFSKRLANLKLSKELHVTIVSMDYDLYQYLLNVQRLGRIPNYNENGNQGNLNEGIGYFGLIRTQEIRHILPQAIQ